MTAPTCGSAGVVPSVLFFLKHDQEISDKRIIKGLATAGLIGNIVKTNGSISGAEVGCQGELGTACAMAAGAAAQILGGSPMQIEYAAEMGFEHNLGLTCDPWVLRANSLHRTECLYSAEGAGSARSILCSRMAGTRCLLTTWWRP